MRKQNLKNCKYLNGIIEYENSIKYRGNVYWAENVSKMHYRTLMKLMSENRALLWKQFLMPWRILPKTFYHSVERLPLQKTWIWKYFLICWNFEVLWFSNKTEYHQIQKKKGCVNSLSPAIQNEQTRSRNEIRQKIIQLFWIAQLA